MTYQITLPCHKVATVRNTDIDVQLERQQLNFRYIGLHNVAVDEHYELCQIPLDADLSAVMLGDGFQMLSQCRGTAGQIEEVGRCPDNNSSYRIYPQDAPKRFYNTLVIEEADSFVLFGFTSCHRFAGYFEIQDSEQGRVVTAFIDGESTYPQDWENSDLESIVVIEANTLDELYQQYASLIQSNHPPRPHVKAQAPIGWCSWYAYYADVTEQDVAKNLDAMQGELAPLDWVLLDDGYQAFMGDWLDPSDKFSSGVKNLIQDIKMKGKRPAIWLAPFIAQPESKIFSQHPDWFVKNHDGQLLKAEDITYGGWRCTPWYILDTSNPEVQDHLTRVVKTMREDWGVELFKLDANYWGTLKGVRYQTGVTGVQAYRMGMQAIADGAGDGWLLGCNAPMWPSLGTVDAMRVSDDVERHPDRFRQIALETFYRSWQHRKLWQIDPDCITLVSLPNQSTERQYYDFHRTAVLASGGLMLSGDPLPNLTPYASQTWQKLLVRQRHTQESSMFRSLSMNHAFLALTDNNDLHCLFNYDESPLTITLTSSRPVHWYDYWTGERLTEEKLQIFEIGLDSGLSSKAIVTA
ncbi:glycoside hydrolase family 36 protein [Vibrio astriarenae]|uniref:glycoside hydrolase family 36 protein n=1 Tax=Vibrio astriarenae TaxID=1481923 RepID=UPI0037352A5E